MIPPSNKPASSSGTIPSYDNCLLNLQSHVFPYRSLRPLTLPSQPPIPAYLSCWWTRDSTDFWGHYLETTSLRFSEPLSSHCLRDNDKPTIAPMTQWREKFKKKKTIDPLFPSSNPAPLVLHKPLRPPTRYPPPIPQSTHFPSWPDGLIPSPLVDRTPCPPENITGGTLLRLREVGLELTEEELRQWALDTLLCLEDWKWLWESPVPVPTPLISLTLPLPHPPWYNASSVDPPSTFVPNVPNTSAPFVNWPHLDTPNKLATCAPVPYVGNLVMWGPVAQPQLQHACLPPEWLTEAVFKSGSRRYDGGNVTIEGPPIPFSPFSLTNCTLLNHFSFDNFVAVAFPDIAGDLNNQI